MKKRLTILFIMLAMVFPTVTVAHASGADSMISFDGDTEQFIYLDGDTDVFDNFQNMYPGEERTATITLVNNDHREMRFYISSDIVDYFGSDTNPTIVYDVNFTIDGQPIFDETVGGEDKIGTNYLQEDVLIATLAQGESAKLVMTVKTNGDTMGNDYQDATGHIQYTFSVEYDDEPATVPEQIVNTVVETVINPITRFVDTGDNTNVGIYAGIGAVCLIAIGGLILTRKKGGDDDNEKK